MKQPFLWLALIGWMLLGSGCATSGSPSTGSNAVRGDLLVAAAGSLQNAFTELGTAYEAAHPGQTVTFTFTSTGNLASQIENGAPFDLFAAADNETVARLASEGLILPESVQPYGQGRLVMVVDEGSMLALGDLSVLQDSRIRHVAIANPAHAPYGVAAQQALERSALWAALEPKLVIGETVGQAVQFVQSGNAEIALTALSVADLPELRWAAVDPTLYEPLDQSVGIVASSQQQPLAQQFIDFLLSDAGQTIMAKYGFAAPP
ncbi:MAG: molybdate ABC transporter substrate-binding protein [Anaerolineales bacterium]|nr:molybdate ABC transporter substrate-binding protein [Anaerolineales bacterium]MCB9129244.1 molybdate ABC transporter substrate-binding protein [Ardenticatenales bacterium]